MTDSVLVQTGIFEFLLDLLRGLPEFILFFTGILESVVSVRGRSRALVSEEMEQLTMILSLLLLGVKPSLTDLPGRFVFSVSFAFWAFVVGCSSTGGNIAVECYFTGKEPAVECSFTGKEHAVEILVCFEFM